MLTHFFKRMSELDILKSEVAGHDGSNCFQITVLEMCLNIFMKVLMAGMSEPKCCICEQEKPKQ